MLMKSPSTCLSAVLLTLIIPLSGFAQREEEHSPVQKEMETINRDARKLNRQYSDPAQKDSSLQIVAEMQKSAETAKGLTPSLAEKKPEPGKAKYMETYKKDMDALIKELAALKDAVASGDSAKTKAELDKLNQLKMSSHKELGVKMGGPGGPGGPGGQHRMGPPDGANQGTDQRHPTQSSPAPQQ
jgi:soluble cytochrome b562